MRTSELAVQAGVNPQTLRYYERQGLLSSPQRTSAGYRIYGQEALRRVRFIRRAQAVGFSLGEIATLLHLSGGKPTDCRAARELAADKAVEVDRRIEDLLVIRELLGQLVERCDEDAEPGRCPMLSEFAEDPVADG